MSSIKLPAFLLLLLLAVPAIAQQQPAPSQAELVEALTIKASLLTQNIDQLLVAVARQKAAAEEADARAKWVLDNWVPK